MIIGIPKEIKTHENRIAITPAGVSLLIKNNHKVLIETQAGKGTGFCDENFVNEGAEIVQTAVEIYQLAEMIVKVKEPLKEEYSLIRAGQIVFTYFHFASYIPLADAMIDTKSVCIAYETVENTDRSLPLLIPMSEVAGRMSIQEGAKYLEKHTGGRGVLLGGVPGVKPANVLVLGGGIVGTQAAKMAAGLGAQVTIMDINLSRLRTLNEIMPSNVVTVMSNEYNILNALKDADLVIGAVLIPGAKAPILVKKEMLKIMKPGSVVIDVAVDQGGCIETCKPTTHENPTYSVDGIVHYCVANMPGAVPYTSTLALTNATLPYVVELANKGWKEACINNPSLRGGLNIVEGKVVHAQVAKALGKEFYSLKI
ncbi:MAG TPA: alanine dehydrogenase [Cytophagaceae bacterium]|jgi:alanine dehydrogenase